MPRPLASSEAAAGLSHTHSLNGRQVNRVSEHFVRGKDRPFVLVVGGVFSRKSLKMQIPSYLTLITLVVAGPVGYWAWYYPEVMGGKLPEELLPQKWTEKAYWLRPYWGSIVGITAHLITTQVGNKLLHP